MSFPTRCNSRIEFCVVSYSFEVLRNSWVVRYSTMNNLKNTPVFVPIEWQKVPPLVLKVLLEVKINHFMKICQSCEGIQSDFEEINAILIYDNETLCFQRWSDRHKEMDWSKYYVIHLDIVDINKYIQPKKRKLFLLCSYFLIH